MTLFIKCYYARIRVFPGSWKEQISGKSKAGLLYTVGSKHMEPLIPELVPAENINTSEKFQ